MEKLTHSDVNTITAMLLLVEERFGLESDFKRYMDGYENKNWGFAVEGDVYLLEFESKNGEPQASLQKNDKDVDVMKTVYELMNYLIKQ